MTEEEKREKIEEVKKKTLKDRGGIGLTNA